MNNSYLFGIAGAILLVVVGVLLLGRDGTDSETNTLLTEPTEAPSSGTDLIPNDDGGNLVDPESAVTESSIDTGVSTSTSSLLEDEETDTGIVTYTSSGFNPKSITINAGDSITFINNSTRNMWVASAIHPTHNEYPEESNDDCLGSSFDACKGVKAGESWSFTFSEVGEWGYHDHLNSSRTGIIVVE